MIRKPSCRGKSLRALEEYGLGRSSEGMARRIQDPSTKAARNDIAEAHFETASWHFGEAREIARDTKTRGDCEDCLGRLGVELCPLIPETEVTIERLFGIINDKERAEVKRALKGENVHRSDPIARKIGSLTSEEIDEGEYVDYLDPDPKKEFPQCPFKIDPRPTQHLADEISRGVDRKVLLHTIGMGTETPHQLSRGRLTGDLPMAEYLDPEVLSAYLETSGL
jgi:hypothetical protein